MLEVLWSRRLHRSVSPMVVAPGVLVAERRTRLVALDPERGDVRWEHRVEDAWGTTATAAGRAFHLTQAGVLHCVDLATGQASWSVRGLPVRHHLAVSGGVVILGGWRGYRPLTRLAAADGRRWSRAPAATSSCSTRRVTYWGRSARRPASSA